MEFMCPMCKRALNVTILPRDVNGNLVPRNVESRSKVAAGSSLAVPETVKIPTHMHGREPCMASGAFHTMVPPTTRDPENIAARTRLAVKKRAEEKVEQLKKAADERSRKGAKSAPASPAPETVEREDA